MEGKSLIYQFDDVRVDVEKFEVVKADIRARLEPKAFETLVFLIEHRGRLVEKKELLDGVWKDAFVTENAMTRVIAQLRKALGDDSKEAKYIETVPTRGYRFIVGVEVREAPEEGAVTDTERARRATAKEMATREAAVARTTSSAAAIISKIKRQKKVATLTLTVLIIFIGGITFGLYKLVGRNQSNSAAPFQPMRIIRITTNGKARAAAISPDGKYVVYAMVEEAGKQSLWLRQVAATSNVQVVPPAEMRYRFLAFSRDGNFLYYVARDQSNPANVLYQVPILGGLPKKLIVGVDTNITLSPDGRRLAFVRDYLDQGEYALMVANADGTGEEKLATRKYPDFFSSLGHATRGGPAWSPDGKIIACSAGSFVGGDYGFYETVVEVRVADGTVKPLSSKTWLNVQQPAWLADGNGLIVRVSGDLYSPEFWQLSYPGGEARKLTKDLNFYQGLSVTADTNTLVTVQKNDSLNIWIAPNGEASRARQITFSTGKDDGSLGLSWAPDGKIVYFSREGGAFGIWIMEADGSNPKQLTIGGWPSVSPDGHYVVFASARTGPLTIWRMDLNGGDAKQLVSRSGAIRAQCSPDGMWVVYDSFSAGKLTLWKVPIDGGDSVQLTDKFSMGPAISPDGKLIACFYKDDLAGRKLAVIPFEGGPPIKIFDYSPSVTDGVLRWTSDGGALTYVDTRGGVSNIWGQPLDGGPPKQLTHFNTEQIYWFDWSRDGRLVLSRGVENSDVVLISGLKAN